MKGDGIVIAILTKKKSYYLSRYRKLTIFVAVIN